MINEAYIKQSWTKRISQIIKTYVISYFHLAIGFCDLFWFAWITEV